MWAKFYTEFRVFAFCVLNKILQILFFVVFGQNSLVGSQMFFVNLLR